MIRSPLCTSAPLPLIGVLISSLPSGASVGMATLGWLPYDPDTFTPLPPLLQAASGTDTAANSQAKWAAGRRIAILHGTRGTIRAPTLPRRHRPKTRGQRTGRPRRLHPGDELVYPFVDGAERVLAQHGALGLVVELQVHPVDGEVAALLLGVLDELAAQPGPGGLRRGLLGL